MSFIIYSKRVPWSSIDRDARPLAIARGELKFEHCTVHSASPRRPRLVLYDTIRYDTIRCCVCIVRARGWSPFIFNFRLLFFTFKGKTNVPYSKRNTVNVQYNPPFYLVCSLPAKKQTNQ